MFDTTYMSDGEVFVRAMRSVATADITIYAGVRDLTRNAPTKVITNVEFAEVGEFDAFPQGVNLREGVVQSLFDQLWDMGLRPADGVNGRPEAAADHIKDLREISIRLLNGLGYKA